MGDHIVRRGAGSGARRNEPRPTAELGKRELQSLIRDQATAAQTAAPADLEAELEIGGDAPARLPASSSPRLLAHTLRREPTPDGTAPASRPGSAPMPAADSVPSDPPSIFDRDVSTIAMPRLERPDVMDAVPNEPLASESAHTRQLRHGRGACTDFDDEPPVPPPADDFDNGHPVTDVAVARGKRRPAAAVAMRALQPSIPPTPRIDRELAANVAPPPPLPRARPYAPAGRILRVLPITLSILVAVLAAYLLLHAGV
jgi:hypothetical protein